MTIFEMPQDIPDIDAEKVEIIENEAIILTVVSTVDGTR